MHNSRAVNCVAMEYNIYPEAQPTYTRMRHAQLLDTKVYMMIRKLVINDYLLTTIAIHV